MRPKPAGGSDWQGMWTMKRIGDASFFRIVDHLLTPTPARVAATHWSIDGVDWQRERHSYSGSSHGFSVEVTTGTKATPPEWVLMIVKEYWRDSNGQSTKSLQWAHIEKGSRTNVVAWLKRQERELEAA